MLVGITQMGGNHQWIVLNFMSGAFCKGDRGFLNFQASIHCRTSANNCFVSGSRVFMILLCDMACLSCQSNGVRAFH